MRFRLVALCAAALLPAAAWSQPMPEGFLCCNLRTDGKWISDINYAESHKRVIPLGTPAKVTGYGRYRVFVDLGDGSKQALGNDYSRDMELGAFAKRYVWAEDPKKKLAGYPAKQRDAITSGRIMKGMTREQVLMAVGYPVSSENAHLDAKVWRLWLSSFAEFQVVFGDDGRVNEIVTDPATRQQIAID
ncbi:hypothetical protein [Aquabacterium sp.]|uniref:hypothetical protein n=1 Tax=Aquabacterium sp. TaxID=1872578 RepID=UPI002B95742C|nr:hypothetical protein [Aquabacterium sp.]HSW07970.1 hypothetical protein [Aquabacterium sp.]